jgi:hypothetical protein
VLLRYLFLPECCDLSRSDSAISMVLMRYMHAIDLFWSDMAFWSTLMLKDAQQESLGDCTNEW